MWLLTKDGVLIPERLIARINRGPDGSAIAALVDAQGRGSSAILALSFDEVVGLTTQQTTAPRHPLGRAP